MFLGAIILKILIESSTLTVSTLKYNCFFISSLYPVTFLITLTSCFDIFIDCLISFLDDYVFCE